MLDKLLFLIGLAGVAVVFADVLVRPGMLLEPAQRWAREQWRTLGAKRIASVTTQAQAEATWNGWLAELDDHWWAKMLWLCYKCVAGQWGFWGYIIRCRAGYMNGWRTALLHTLPEHIAFTAFTIIAAIILHKWTQEN